MARRASVDSRLDERPSWRVVSAKSPPPDLESSRSSKWSEPKGFDRRSRNRHKGLPNWLALPLPPREHRGRHWQSLRSSVDDDTDEGDDLGVPHGPRGWVHIVDRSEEHTSELQSRGHLVCRLLLEKKKR